jgi:hypothetical protein
MQNVLNFDCGYKANVYPTRQTAHFQRARLTSRTDINKDLMGLLVSERGVRLTLMQEGLILLKVLRKLGKNFRAARDFAHTNVDMSLHLLGNLLGIPSSCSVFAYSRNSNWAQNMSQREVITHMV